MNVCKNLIIKRVYIVLSFCCVDLWLRFLTKDIDLYSIYNIVPNLFTLLWAVIITSLIFLFPSRIARIIYGFIYFFYAIYAIVQYGYYIIFGKILFLSDFLFAGEGSDYFSYILEIITVPIIIQIILVICIGVVGCIFFPSCNMKNWKNKGIIIVLICLLLFIINEIPSLYEKNSISENEDIFQDPAYEYERFVNSAYDMQLTGVYQFLAKDISQNVKKLRSNGSDEKAAINEISSFFSTKQVDSNEMTGVFKGKNVIIVMMESVDDWLITESDMPTLHYMMNHGINFTNMYTPNYSSGYTINTEFAFNTSTYPLSNENYIYTLINNDFNNSIANIFKQSGYRVESYHYNTPDYYNRGKLHDALGYEKYNSFFEYESDYEKIRDDRFVYTCDKLYEDITDTNDERPFMSFVITVSAHLAYVPFDPLYITATEEYPQYKQGDITEETILRAKARLTDDMFKGLLERLEADGILDDTVIVGFSDHYSYGVTDTKLLQQLSDNAGNSILENTPAFVYCSSMENSVMIDKVMQITDLAPTIENLMGIDVPCAIMGQDVMDENYKGFAIFPNNTWITNEAYIKNGRVVYNNGMTSDEMILMNELIQKTYLVNDYILKYNY